MSGCAPSPPAWTLQNLELDLELDVDQRWEALYQVRKIYETADNEELAAALAGDYLQDYIGNETEKWVTTTKPSKFTTVFSLKEPEDLAVPVRLPERLRPYKPDQIRVDRGDWFRAAGDVECVTCGCAYYDHAPVVGYTWLHKLCNGSLVKL